MTKSTTAERPVTTAAREPAWQPRPVDFAPAHALPPEAAAHARPGTRPHTAQRSDSDAHASGDAHLRQRVAERNAEQMALLIENRRLRREAEAARAREAAVEERLQAVTAVATANARLNRILLERDERRRQELEHAGAIQRRLLPETVTGWPGVLEVAVRFRPAAETSGDFYDVVRLTSTGSGGPAPLQIAVGDVAGKGVAAALVTALACSALRSTAAPTVQPPVQTATPAETLRLAGARLYRDVGERHFVACALAVVEPPGGHHHGPRLTLSNAAQVPVLLCRGGRAVELAAPGDRLPLGVRPDGDYRDVTVDLVPGDVVVFSSDGLVEAPAEAPARAGSARRAPAPPAATASRGELFGFDRYHRSAARWSGGAGSAEAVADGIWSDVTAWCGERSGHDDMTLLVLRVPGGSPAGDASPAATTEPPLASGRGTPGITSASV